jgi:hypothetical protein
MEGRLVQSLRATVTEFAINQPVPSSEFKLDLPNGTVVHDRRNGRHDVRWIGGDPALAKASSIRVFGLIAANMLVLAILVFLAVVRYRRRRNK